MNPMKSSQPNARMGIAGAMRPLWRVGIPATAALSTLLSVIFALALDGCSGSKGGKTELSSSARPALPASSPSSSEHAALPDVSTPGPSARKKTKTSRVEHRGAAATYADETYGISFSYPRTYSLVTREKKNLNESSRKIPMNFVQPGGVSLATVALPDGPATSLFHVNVNKELTAQACRQFAVPANYPVNTSDKVSLRGVDFTRVENGTEQNDLRYYHHYENGVCYEFAMAVEEQDGNTKPVDHLGLFEQLEQIMATVKIEPDAVSAVTAELPQTLTKSGKSR